MKTIIGIDNGVSGGIAFLIPSAVPSVHPTPVKEVFWYQKQARKLNRLDHVLFAGLLLRYVPSAFPVHVVIERPMVMPARFEATVSALRCYEATLVILEQVLPQTSIETVDSRAWQKEMLPAGLKGPQLKKASLQRGIELFPMCRDWIVRQGDADPLLIAEWARRNR